MQRAITSSAAAYPAASYSLLPPPTSATRTVVCPLESIVPTLAEKYHGDDEIVRTRWRALCRRNATSVAEQRPMSPSSDDWQKFATYLHSADIHWKHYSRNLRVLKKRDQHGTRKQIGRAHV